jgi:outer membrane protein OmpA-like peptidoglycan-associated protein
VLQHPEQDAILRLLWGHKAPIRASRLFAQVDAGCDVAPLASEAKKLDRAGLIEHGYGTDGMLWVRLTKRGRWKTSFRQADLVRPATTTLIVPALAACISVQPKVQVAPAQPAIELQLARMEQVIVDGELVWTWCFENGCPQATPKAPVTVAATPLPAPAKPVEPVSSGVPGPSASRPEAPAVARGGLPPPDRPLVGRGSVSSAPSAPVATPTQQPVPAPVSSAPAVEPLAVLPASLTRNEAPGSQTAPAAARSRHAIFFDTGSALPSRQQGLATRELSKTLTKAASIRLVGMTDGTGHQPLNRVLAQRRAEQILIVLVANGIPRDIIEIDTHIVGDKKYAFGGGKLGVPDAGLRRVEVLVRYEKGAPFPEQVAGL